MEAKIAYDKSDLRAITKSFKAMEGEAATQARKTSNALAQYAAQKIQIAAADRKFANKAVRRVADGVRISKTSKIGEISFGFASQKFSGGGDTKILWPGYEFGTNKYKQFPVWSGKYGRGSRGWFIYPTLRAIQPEIIRQWEEAFSDIIKEWTYDGWK